MTADQRPRRVDHVVWRAADTGVVVLNPQDGQYFSLDGSAGRVWALCDGERSVAEIAGILEDEYDAPIDTIRADVFELLGELAGERLVDVR